MDSEIEIPPEEDLYIQGKQAAADLGETSTVQTDRWKWMRWLVVIILFLGLASVIFGVIGVFTTRDVQNAVDTSKFSEEQRQARSLRADCVSAVNIDSTIARSEADVALDDVVIAIVTRDLTAIGETLNQLTVHQENVSVQSERLKRVKDGTLCTKKEFGVVDTPPDS